MKKQDMNGVRTPLDVERRHNLGAIPQLEEEVSNFSVDSALSSSSTHAVENRVITNALSGLNNIKVDKVTGKGLSSNDFTDGDKSSIHTHSNKSVLDTITQAKIDQWDAGSGGGGGETLPIGTILPYSHGTIPDNYMLCDGSAISRTTYADLYAKIGTTYGSGDGSTTFNLPNLKGKVGVGKDGTQTEFDTLGETGGEKTHILTTNEMPSHNHTGGVYGKGGSLSAEGLDANVVWGSGTMRTTTYGFFTDNTGGGQAHNNLQPYLVVNYIIKVAQTTVITAQVTNSYSTSTSDSYSCDYINDINTYSTTEQVVGTWIDGKPIYRKVVTFSRDNSSQFTISFSGVDKFIKIDGTAYGNTGLKHILYHVSDSDQFRCYVQANNDLTILVGSTHPRTPFTGYMIVEYTKTAD